MAKCLRSGYSSNVGEVPNNLPFEAVASLFFIHRLISPMHQTCTRLLLMSSVDPAFALLNSSVNPSIQPELKTNACTKLLPIATIYSAKQWLSEQLSYDMPMYNN